MELTQPDNVPLPHATSEKGSYMLQFVAVFSVTLSYLAIGSFIGWSSPTFKKLESSDSHIQLNSFQQAWIGSILSGGVLFVPLPTSFVIDAIGRKKTILFSSVPFIVSWLMVIFASSVVELYISRLIAALGVGIAFIACPIYIGEIAEDKVRGALGTLFQFMMNFGTLFGYSVGPYVSYSLLGILCLIFPALFLVTFVWMPESPYFLISKKRRTDAEKSLMRLRGVTQFDSVREELDKIAKTIEIQAKEKGSVRDLFGSWGNIKVMLLAVGLMLTQTYSGIGPVLVYATIIFQKSGSSLDENISTIILGVVQLIISMISSGLVDRVGRRPLLLISLVGSSVSLVMEGVYFYLDKYTYDGDVPTRLHWMPLTFLISYLIVYSLGLGPLPWAIAGEIFPNNVKGISVAFVAMANAFGGFTSILLFNIISEEYGDHVAFWCLAAWCIVATLIFAIVLPETKGKSFLQISEEMGTGRFRISDLKGKQVSS